MKKLYILLLGFAFACNAFAQQSASVPVPADPDGMFFEWYDYTPYTWPNGEVTVASGWFYLTYGMDLYNNLVTNDYDISIDSCIVHELNYTILDREKFSYSIYTDMDEIFVFNPEEYSEFTEPTTDVYIFNILPLTPDGYGSTANLEFWGPHFPNRTNKVDGIEGMEPFFQWRIGIQTHYTDNGVTTSSNIVYYEIGPKPVTLLGDVNADGKLSIDDVSTLISYLLGGNPDPFNKFNADGNDDNKLTIADVSTIISIMLN